MKREDNPLLNIKELPAFSQIRPDHVAPALDFILDRNRRRIRELERSAERADWAGFVQPLEDLDEDLTRMWSPVSHLNAVKDSDPLREQYEACLPKLSAYATEVGQNVALFRGYQEIRQGPEYQRLDRAQKKIIDNALRDFRLTGVDLPPAKKRRFKEIQQALSTLGNRFERNVMDATNDWHLHLTDAADLEGLPPSALDMARQLATRNDQTGWRFTLDFPSYLSFMMHAENRALRKAMYEAYVTRASDAGPGAGRFDNGPVMLDILRLRREAARLLDFGSYAELSLATKMAESPEQVLEFARDLASRARPVAQRELAQLKEFAAEHLDIGELEAWDMLFCSERLKQSLYAFSEEEVRPYFPAEQALSGMFAVVGKLYGLTIQPVEGVDVWDPQVRVYEIRDTEQRVRGRFYVDLYVRPHKRGGAWMDAFTSRKASPRGVQVPVAYLTCNFSIPTAEKPALLSHEEVTTLFHEFGHGLHHMLTLVDYVGVSGINGVAWDAVELPSQFMENWCWQSEALDLVGGHYQTGEGLPPVLLEKMRRARNFQSGMQLLRQLEFALFDMRLHHEFIPGGEAAIQDVLDEVRSEVAVVRPPAYNRFQHSFSHIFAGGYAAGYYSYKWAEVLSADAFGLFLENGVFDQATGRSFMHNILETGGSIEPMDAFVAFRGRKPELDALLRDSGLLES